MERKFIDKKLQNKFEEVWQPIKNTVLEKLNEFIHNIYFIPNTDRRQEILQHINKIKILIDDKESFPYLYINELTDEQYHRLT